jgi:FMN-dependent NADH-azoreductase
MSLPNEGNLPMSNILVLDSAATGDASVSRTLVREAVDALETPGTGGVVYRDLDAAPLPHLTNATVAGIRAEPASDSEHAARALSDELIAELREADVIVIGAPMYNCSVPTTLRAWFDHVLRAGETFRYTEKGPQGLLPGKRVIVVESRGGLYSEGPAAAADFQEPYLRHLLGFMGLTDVTFIRAEKLGFGPEARATAIAAATDGIRAAAAAERAAA